MMPDLLDNIARCEHCKVLLSGRSDKRFCSLKCKNAWHNHRNRENNMAYKTIDKQLHLNRVILKDFYEESQGMKFIPLVNLYQRGFNPISYNGNVTVNETSERLFVVYDYAFIINDSTQIKIYHNDGGFYNP